MMTDDRDGAGRRIRIGVLGGGFTGAAFAVHLARASGMALDIEIVEPRPAPGQGLAYGSAGPEHRLNVPSDRMVVFAEDRAHFTRWLKESGRWQADPGALTPEGYHYSRRRDFGAYVTDLLAQEARSNPSGSAIRHWRQSAVGIARANGAWHVSMGDGEAGVYDHAVICMSHAAPPFRWPLTQDAEGLPHLVRDPWRDDAVAAIPPHADVTIIGAGLTMCDAVVSLRGHGHRGAIHAIARRALMPRPQLQFDEPIDLFRGETAPATAIALLRLVRRRVREAAAEGLSWRVVIDGVRRELFSYWQTLPVAERIKIARHLRAFWDVHRFRMAPQIQALMAQGRDQGWLRISAGRIDEIGCEAGRFAIRWTPRGGGKQTRAADAVINCTGPDSDLSRSANPLIRAIIEQGHARPDALRMGFDVDAQGRLLDRHGTPSPALWAAGPSARAIVGEATGVSEASAHARLVANAVAESLGAGRRAALQFDRNPSGDSA